jgi:cell division septum initiation protein DivIVA
MAKTNEELEREIEFLKAQIAALTQTNPSPTKPFAKFDPTANLTMPQSAIEAMTAVVGDRDLASIVQEQRSGVAQPSSMIKPDPSAQPKQIGKNGWLEERKLEPPPGVDLIDRIAQGFAERERRERR